MESPPPLFKGIALFTPGGDLIYSIDPTKQARWHLNLCLALQEILDLSEPPHFLVPCYTATVDRWQNQQTQQIQITATAAPSVLHYQPLLNAIFSTDRLVWQPASLPAEVCDPAVLLTYRQQFPELWLTHDLIVRYESPHSYPPRLTRPAAPSPEAGYVLRLFVSGYSAATERILQKLHQVLEESLNRPYTLKVIDVFQHPEQAEQDHILATPTLVKAWPPPVRRIVGNLETVEQLLRVLDVLEDLTE